MTHYETLGVARDASPAEIKRAWRRASSAAHPDREGGSQERQQAINRAYEVLSDPDRRADYDATGEDRQKPSIDQEAHESLVQLLSGMLAAEGDLLTHAHAVVDQAREQLLSNVLARKNQVDKLGSRRGKVRRKDNGADNLVEHLIEARITALEGEIRLLEHGLRVNAALKQALQAYESDPPPAPRTTVFDSPYNSNPTYAGGGPSSLFGGLFGRNNPWRKA